MACTKSMRGCAYTCGHRQLIEAYYAARDQWELDAEAASVGYATELAEYAAHTPRPTFKRFLTEQATADPDQWAHAMARSA